MVGIEIKNKNTSAYQCDIGPIVGTSVVLEVEITDSDSSDEAPNDV